MAGWAGRHRRGQQRAGRPAPSCAGLDYDRLRGRAEIELLLPPATFVDVEAALEGAHRAGSPASPRTMGAGLGRPGSPTTSPPGRSSPGWSAWIDRWRRRLEVRLRLECFAAAGLGLGGPALAQAEERARMLTDAPTARRLPDPHGDAGRARQRRRGAARLRAATGPAARGARGRPWPPSRPSTGGCCGSAGSWNASQSSSAWASRSSQVTLPTSSGWSRPMWSRALLQSSSSSSPTIAYPHMQMILSAMATSASRPHDPGAGSTCPERHALPSRRRGAGGPGAHRLRRAEPEPGPGTALAPQRHPTPTRCRCWCSPAPTGFRHASIDDGVAAVRKLGAGQRLHRGGGRRPGADRGGHPGAVRVVVFLSTTGDPLDQQQAALRQWVEGGGGWVGVHAAADAFYGWPWYGELVGAWFKRHRPSSGRPSA